MKASMRHCQEHHMLLKSSNKNSKRTSDFRVSRFANRKHQRMRTTNLWCGHEKKLLLLVHQLILQKQVNILSLNNSKKCLTTKRISFSSTHAMTTSIKSENLEMPKHCQSAPLKNSRVQLQG